MAVPPEPSAAGASASREYERRRASRDARVRERFGALGGVVLAVSGEPQHQRAWASGAEGEVKLARKLEKWTAEHGGDWPLLGRLQLRSVPILPPRHAAKLCRAEGPLDPAQVERLAGELARRLPPA